MEFVSPHNYGTYQALAGDLGHLTGWEEALCDWVGHRREGGGKEKWRWDDTGIPEGQLGEGRCSHDRRGPLMARGSAGKGRDLWGIRGLEGNAASITTACLVPSEPAGV